MDIKELPQARTEGDEITPVVGQLAIGTHIHTHTHTHTQDPRLTQPG